MTLLIIKQILLVSTIGNGKRKIRRICIPMLVFKALKGNFPLLHQLCWNHGYLKDWSNQLSCLHHGSNTNLIICTSHQYRFFVFFLHKFPLENFVKEIKSFFSWQTFPLLKKEVFFILSQSGAKRKKKKQSPHQELNLRPLDSVSLCSITENCMTDSKENYYKDLGSELGYYCNSVVIS